MMRYPSSFEILYMLIQVLFDKSGLKTRSLELKGQAPMPGGKVFVIS